MSDGYSSLIRANKALRQRILALIATGDYGGLFSAARAKRQDSISNIHSSVYLLLLSLGIYYFCRSLLPVSGFIVLVIRAVLRLFHLFPKVDWD